MQTTLLNSIHCMLQDIQILNTGIDYSEEKNVYGYNTPKHPDYILKCFEV